MRFFLIAWDDYYKFALFNFTKLIIIMFLIKYALSNICLWGGWNSLARNNTALLRGKKCNFYLNKLLTKHICTVYLLEEECKTTFFFFKKIRNYTIYYYKSYISFGPMKCWWFTDGRRFDWNITNCESY